MAIGDLRDHGVAVVTSTDESVDVLLTGLITTDVVTATPSTSVSINEHGSQFPTITSTAGTAVLTEFPRGYNNATVRWVVTAVEGV